MQHRFDFTTGEHHFQASRQGLLISRPSHPAAEQHLAILDRGEHIRVAMQMSVLMSMSRVVRMFFLLTVEGFGALFLGNDRPILDGKDAIVRRSTEMTAQFFMVFSNCSNFHLVYLYLSSYLLKKKGVVGAKCACGEF